MSFTRPQTSPSSSAFVIILLKICLPITANTGTYINSTACTCVLIVLLSTLHMYLGRSSNVSTHFNMLVSWTPHGPVSVRWARDREHGIGGGRVGSVGYSQEKSDPMFPALLHRNADNEAITKRPTKTAKSTIIPYKPLRCAIQSLPNFI